MKVAIIHPWLPQYRTMFFRELISRARSVGIEVYVFHGGVDPRWAGRNDLNEAHDDHIIPLRTRFLRVGSRAVAIKSLRPVRERGPYDLVIVEHAIKNFETYELLIRSSGPVAFWGHGRTYSSSPNRLLEWGKGALARKGAWFFAYTAGGAESVIDGGFSPDRVTVLNNTFDTSDLVESLEAISDDECAEVSRTLDLRAKTAIYIGGLDSYKRVPMLVDTAVAAHALNSDFRLVVVGDGDERETVENAARVHPFVRYVGPKFGRAKAVLLKASEVIVSPGSIGLLVIDSFVAQRPCVVTSWHQHGPEAEYLENERNSRITLDSPEALAFGVVSLLEDPVLLGRLRAACAVDARRYTVENMLDRFLEGLNDALAGSRQ